MHSKSNFSNPTNSYKSGIPKMMTGFFVMCKISVDDNLQPRISTNCFPWINCSFTLPPIIKIILLVYKYFINAFCTIGKPYEWLEEAFVSDELYLRTRAIFSHKIQRIWYKWLFQSRIRFHFYRQTTFRGLKTTLNLKKWTEIGQKWVRELPPSCARYVHITYVTWTWRP